MTLNSPAAATPAVKDVTEVLFAQLMGVMGLKHPSWLTRSLYPIFLPPIKRLSALLVDLDRNIALTGWNQAVNLFMSHLVTKIHLYGEENIPTHGPLMVICNHPAALDVVILAAAIPRDDLKILISDIPIVQMFPHLASHCIPVYYDLDKRMHTIREAIRHLQNDGALFLFPRGNVEPDPAVSPGAEQSLAGWSASSELFLRQAPQTLTVVAVASGMLSAGWYKNPIIQIWKKYEQRQKVAEIFQIAAQLITGKTPAATPTVRFSPPLSIAELGGERAANGELLAGMIAQARRMLSDLPQP